MEAVERVYRCQELMQQVSGSSCQLWRCLPPPCSHPIPLASEKGWDSQTTVDFNLVAPAAGMDGTPFFHVGARHAAAGRDPTARTPAFLCSRTTTGTKRGPTPEGGPGAASIWGACRRAMQRSMSQGERESALKRSLHQLHPYNSVAHYQFLSG